MSMNRVCKDEAGVAMVISLLVLLVMTMIGVLFLVQTRTETQISGHDMRATQALYNAEAGYGEALARMSFEDDAAYIGQAQNQWLSEPGWGTYVVQSQGAALEDPAYAASETDGLDNNGDGEIDEQGERYPEVVTAQTGNDIIDYDWVRVEYKLNAASQPILYGNHDNNVLTPSQFNLTNGAPVLVVTSSGLQGSAHRTVEVEAVKEPFPTLDTAIYAEDDDFQFNGVSFLISGEDHDPSTGAVISGNPEVPAIMTTENPQNIKDQLAGKQINNVYGEGTEPSVASAPVDLDLVGLRDAYAPQAEVVLPSGTYANSTWGGLDDYNIVHCTGDLHNAGNLEGAGILIIDGDFTCTGQFLWTGLVLVLGDISFAGGGQGIHLYGSLLVQGNIDQQTVGGNADIMYSSEALNRLTALSPYVVASWREL